LQGFDVPAANVVISYNHLKDSVELCQRFGRARQVESSIVVLEERHDRPVSNLETVRVLQDELVQDYNPSANDAASDGTERRRQTDRERSAFRSILENVSKCQMSPTAAMNDYVKKTKALKTVEYRRLQDGTFRCTMRYKSAIRSLKADATGTTKKIAERGSALLMLKMLTNEARAS